MSSSREQVNFLHPLDCIDDIISRNASHSAVSLQALSASAFGVAKPLGKVRTFDRQVSQVNVNYIPEMLMSIPKEIKSLNKRLAHMKSHRKGIEKGTVKAGDWDAKHSLSIVVGQRLNRFCQILDPDLNLQYDKSGLPNTLKVLQRNFTRAANRLTKKEARVVPVVEAEAIAAHKQVNRAERSFALARLRQKVGAVASRVGQYGRDLGVVLHCAPSLRNVRDAFSMSVTALKSQFSEIDLGYGGHVSVINSRRKDIDDRARLKIKRALQPEVTEFNAAADAKDKRQTALALVDLQIEFLEGMIETNKRHLANAEQACEAMGVYPIDVIAEALKCQPNDSSKVVRFDLNPESRFIQGAAQRLLLEAA